MALYWSLFWTPFLFDRTAYLLQEDSICSAKVIYFKEINEERLKKSK